MTAHNNIISLTRKNLLQCGYSEPLLQDNYVYGDGIDTRTVPLAAFSSPVHDSRTSCISVIRCDELPGATEQYVYQFRGFGAPIIFVCCNESLQWWNLGASGAKYERTVSKSESNAFFASYKHKFSPDKIWRAKNLGRIETRHQLSFVDIGLVPLLEEEMGERLGDLMKRVMDLLRNGFTENQLKKRENQRWVFQAGFWVLCAKILQDKHVRDFIRLDMTNVDAVIEAVKAHYGAQEGITFTNKRQKEAFEAAASEVSRFASLSNLTTEAFGYMYENVLVDKKLRTALGIHATPSYLVDYMVWQLWPWIQEIPEDKRVVLEPTCGHAPFLTGAMRLLRELFNGNEKEFHRYAKKHLIGIEKDSFALEIARLSLTIADVPNPNGWSVIEEDVYLGDRLSKKAKNATILLCNPPFEDFKPEEQNAYKKAGQKLNCHNKGAEMLWRTLPYMQEGSVFGVILPRAFLHKRNLVELRKSILRDFELSQICLLPENVFRFAGHRSVVIFGRKTGMGEKQKIQNTRLLYKTVNASQIDVFKEKYKSRDMWVFQSKFSESRVFDLRVRELDDIWNYCEANFSTISSVAEVGRGIEFKHIEESTSRIKFKKARQGFVRFQKTTVDRKGQTRKVDIKITELPDFYWMDLSDEAIENPRYGMPTGQSHILINYARTSSSPWRLKALIDRNGKAVTNAFEVVRLISTKWDMNVLWALLNSPLANAFVFCHSMERHNLEGTVRKIPLPDYNKEVFKRIRYLVDVFFSINERKKQLFGTVLQEEQEKQTLLAIDAEVMRLYDLPPKMEKQILDLFQGIQRKGVDFEFKGYYPEGFESAIPLHEYLSEEYQRSTVMFADDWVEKHRSPEINEVLRMAAEAFEEG